MLRYAYAAFSYMGLDPVNGHALAYTGIKSWCREICTMN